VKIAITLLRKFLTYNTHCSYLDIYISQNIRLCKGDFEGQFQTSLQARIMNFFYLKIHIYWTHFPSIFCRSCQIHCFLFTVAAISKKLICLSHVFPSNCNSNMSTHWNSSNSVQKAFYFVKCKCPSSYSVE
jgi:hypothetical protein